MKVSFIIPAYNESKGIAATVGQFKAKLENLRQVEYEVIVSDNGSTDNTVELARAAGAKVVIRPSDTRTTIGECRNRGARAATGDVLWFIDADVRLVDATACVDEVAAYFHDHANVVAATLRITIYPEEAIWADNVVYTFFNGMIYLMNRLFKTGASAGDCMMVRRSEFERVKGFRPELKTSEDFELFGRLAKVGEIGYFWHRKIAMSPRRIRRDGWPKVLWQWFRNWFNQTILGKVSTVDWEARR